MWKKLKTIFKKLFFRGKFKELNYVACPSFKTLISTVFKTIRFCALSIIGVYLVDIFFTSVVSIVVGFIN